MNFIARHINAIGILLLTTFATAAAGLYWNVPQRIQRAAAATPVSAKYACPMHPEVTSDKPGKCPKCGMSLVTAEASTDVRPGCAHAASGVGCCGVPAPDCTLLPESGCTRNIHLTPAAQSPKPPH